MVWVLAFVVDKNTCLKIKCQRSMVIKAKAIHSIHLFNKSFCPSNLIRFQSIVQSFPLADAVINANTQYKTHDANRFCARSEPKDNVWKSDKIIELHAFFFYKNV